MKLDTKQKSNFNIICEAERCSYEKFIITIFNEKGEVICSEVTYNKCSFNVNKKGKYKIKVEICDSRFSPSVASRWIDLDPKLNCTQYFQFSQNIKTPQMTNVTFRLDDANYSNLPINQGVISLWQNMT